MNLQPPLVSPRGSRTGEVLKLDVDLQVKLSPVLVSIRDQCLRRGPIGFLHLADASGIKSTIFNSNASSSNHNNNNSITNQVFMEPDRYRNLLIDNGMKISKEEGQSLNLAFCDPRGYFSISLFYERLIAIFYGERRERTEKLFAILAEGRKSLSMTRESVESSEWDSIIPREKRDYSALTFCGLMAGVSVVTRSDGEFDDILRSFQPVAKKQASSSSSDTTAARTAHLFETHQEAHQQRKSSPVRERQAALVKDHQKPENCPRHIAGFMGHVSYASEHFGKTHYQTMREVPKIAHINKERYEREAREVPPQTMEIKYRGGNKSNIHNFVLS